MTLPRAPKSSAGRAANVDALRSERLAAAIDRAVAGNGDGDLVDLLARNSGLPGPAVNLDLARAVGASLAARGAPADAIITGFVATEDEYLRVVAAMALAAQSIPVATKKGSRARVEQALEKLQELAEDPRHGVRRGLVAALRVRLAAVGEPAVADLAAWTDGYLQAHIALEALADRTWLTTLASSQELLARLEEAFAMADASSRSAERTQGMRVLREGLPKQIATFAGRFPETLTWLEAKTACTRPETRAVVEEAVSSLRRVQISDVVAARFTALLEASAKPRRDADRVVHGTRKRSRGRS